MQLPRVHLGAQDGVDASLVAALLPKPADGPKRQNRVRQRRRCRSACSLNLDREISFPNTRFHARATSAQLSPWGLRFCPQLVAALGFIFRFPLNSMIPIDRRVGSKEGLLISKMDQNG